MLDSAALTTWTSGTLSMKLYPELERLEQRDVPSSFSIHSLADLNKLDVSGEFKAITHELKVGEAIAGKIGNVEHQVQVIKEQITNGSRQLAGISHQLANITPPTML